ncbi:DNA polymerase III subunit delta' [Fructilactobacillus florum]|uniref:DNA polymerase III subunit delta n=2 Tax=Fructilactobacillus florum TaxID=640331 RepID=A0A0R2CX06_9LACO|nr:DNA polymerase III subunit delta' [Fructilactobacillus florum]EKK20034.1 DNA polymerase III delta prime subunit [Fructilactobacillus florum 2F]KRM92553.1 hypothetical protein FC87_GL000165 [Fructilactobacillus florum DSM 22689 = JCM 16035]
MKAAQVLTAVEMQQPELEHHFLQVIAKHELSHAYLFSGTSGVGKKNLALLLTMRLFCSNVQATGVPCGKCNECLRIAAGEHPDVLMVKPTGSSLKVDQIREVRREFSKSAVEGQQKVFIISEAETMTTEAANSLLKSLEEPPTHVTVFLLTNNYHRLLPTIISRTQVVELAVQDQAELKTKLKQGPLPHSTIQLLLNLTSDARQIERLTEDDWIVKSKQGLERWFRWLLQGDWQAFLTVQTNLVPLMRDRNDQDVTIQMICFLFQEVLQVKYQGTGSEQLAFGDDYKMMQQAANSLSDQQLIAIIENVLTISRFQQNNVSFQNILEAITLKSLREFQ